MEKNTDERVVVMDRRQFDHLRALASDGAREFDNDEALDAVIRHVHKFNPAIPTEDGGEKAKDLDKRRQYAKLARHWRRFHPSKIYVKGWIHRVAARPQAYYLPAVIVGRGDAGTGGEVMMSIEFQVSDEYQREAFLFMMRTCAVHHGSQTHPRFGYQRFNGHPVPGGDGITIAGRWSHRQRRRLLKGQAAKLHFTVDVTNLTDHLPENALPCSGLFQGMYFLPS